MKEIIEFLKQNGSKNVQKRMSENGGEQFCYSYIDANVTQHNVTKEEALGWLEQDLMEIYNN
jgi:hypothetical protein